jgi:hypothetical protein
VLIESYVIGFAEVKRCVASLRPNDFVVVSENIFMLRENATAQPVDLLADSTPKKRFEEHQEALKRSLAVFRKDMLS